jgi:hypothetical protein
LWPRWREALVLIQPATHGRPTTRSQTWRTFFANHFGGQTFVSPLMFADVHDEDIVVDASDLSFRRVPSIDASCASIDWTSVDWRRSLQWSSLRVRLGQNQLQDRTGARKSSGRDPPPAGYQPSWRSRRLSFVRADGAWATVRLWETVRPRVLGHRSFRVSTQCAMSRQRRRKTDNSSVRDVFTK